MRAVLLTATPILPKQRISPPPTRPATPDNFLLIGPWTYCCDGCRVSLPARLQHRCVMGHVARMGDSASEHVARNRAHWNERAPAHAASSDYGFSRFAEDRSYLSYAVRFDLPRLGSIAGLRGVHLQCH